MSKRPAMVGSVIREIIAPVLRDCPPECGMVSLTRIEVSEDFSYATVYVSALTEPERAVTFLEERRVSLQAQLGGLRRKRIPKLRFRIDRSGEKENRIDDLLASDASSR